MTAELACCDPTRVTDLWPQVRPLIEEAMRRGDMGSFDDVERDVISGNAYLWVAIDEFVILAATVTKVTESDKGRLCTIVACGGQDWQRFGHMITDLENYARAEHCKAMEICGRVGWMRLLTAYRPVKVILRRDL